MARKVSRQRRQEIEREYQRQPQAASEPNAGGSDRPAAPDGRSARTTQQRWLWPVLGCLALPFALVFVVIVVTLGQAIVADNRAHQEREREAAEKQRRIAEATPISPATLTGYCQRAVQMFNDWEMRGADERYRGEPMPRFVLPSGISIDSIERLWGTPQLSPEVIEQQYERAQKMRERLFGKEAKEDSLTPPAVPPVYSWSFYFDHAGIAQSRGDKPEGYCPYAANFEVLNKGRVQLSVVKYPEY